MTFSRASWASSPFQGVVGTLVMLMLRCSFRTSRLYCSTWVPFTLRGESGLSHPTGQRHPRGDTEVARGGWGHAGPRCHLGRGWLCSVTQLLWSWRLL